MAPPLACGVEPSGSQCPELEGAGAVYLYRQNDLEPIYAGYELAQTLTAPNPGAHDLFGSSLALQGDRLAVAGGRRTEAGIMLFSNDWQPYVTGFVDVFERNPETDLFEHVGRIETGVRGGEDEFGAALAWRDDALFVGAPGMGDAPESGGLGFEAGAVFAYGDTEEIPDPERVPPDEIPPPAPQAEITSIALPEELAAAGGSLSGDVGAAISGAVFTVRTWISELETHVAQLVWWDGTEANAIAHATDLGEHSHRRT